jgi:tetratricopeptide (TPR) repeat protein
MTPESTANVTPSAEVSSTLLSTPPPRRAGKRLKVVLAVIGVVLLLAGSAAGVWWWRRPARPPVPPQPQEIADPEVAQAVTQARQRVLNKPFDANAWGHFGMVLQAHELLPEADQCYVEAAHLDPNAPNWPYGRGLIALTKESDRAVPLLRQALALAGHSGPPYDSAIRLQLAEALLERQQLDEAEQLLQEESRRQPQEPRVVFDLAMVAENRGDAKTARELLLSLRDNPLTHKRVLSQLAALARADMDSKTAARYENEVESLPDDPAWKDPLWEEISRLQVGHHARRRMIAQYEWEHNYRQVAELYLQEIQVDPTAWGYAAAGTYLCRSGEYKSGLFYLREALRLDSNNAFGHNQMAEALYIRAEAMSAHTPPSEEAQMLFHEAIEHARKTTELQPTRASAYYFWGMSLMFLGDPAAALRPLQHGVECAPTDFQLQLALGQVLLELGRLPEAEEHLNNARDQAPESGRPRVDRAFERLRKKKGA